MIIVEQSLNVALAIADRAIFLEKGEVRFEGAAAGAARTRRPRPRRVLRDRGRLMTLATIVTWNLLFKGVIGGLITALVAMGIVLVYRSSRVINFAVGNMGVPATALFAVMAGKHGWPYWPALVGALDRRHAHGHGGRARGDPPAVQVAARHRAGRDDRRRAALRGGHARVARLPHRLAADAVPAAVHAASGIRASTSRCPRASCSC